MTLDRDDIQAIAETTAPMVARMVAEIMGQNQAQGVDTFHTRQSVCQDLQEALSRRDKRRR
mgnify:CR=1 FL=1